MKYHNVDALSDTDSIPVLAADGWPLGSQVLPEGYRLFETLNAAPIIGLIALHYPLRPDELPPTEEEWSSELKAISDAGFSTTGVGVEFDEELVGFARLTVKGTEGFHSDLVVHKDHRGYGLGRAIIDRHVALADEQGLTWLSVPEVAVTNSLRNYYIDRHGFKPVDEAKLIRFHFPGIRQLLKAD